MEWFCLIWDGFCLFMAGFMFARYGVGSLLAWWTLVPGVILLVLLANKLRAES